MAFLVTDANDIKKHVAPQLLNLQLESFLARRTLVDSLGSVMATLVNMKRASVSRKASVLRNLAEDTLMRF